MRSNRAIALSIAARATTALPPLSRAHSPNLDTVYQHCAVVLLIVSAVRRTSAYQPRITIGTSSMRVIVLPRELPRMLVSARSRGLTPLSRNNCRVACLRAASCSSDTEEEADRVEFETRT